MNDSLRKGQSMSDSNEAPADPLIPKPLSQPPQPLAADNLRWRCDPAKLSFKTTADLEPIVGVVGQDDAVEALRFGLEIDAPGQNIFVRGLTGTGRMTLVRRLLEEVQDDNDIQLLGQGAESVRERSGDRLGVFEGTTLPRPLREERPERQFGKGHERGPALSRLTKQPLPVGDILLGIRSSVFLHQSDLHRGSFLGVRGGAV